MAALPPLQTSTPARQSVHDLKVTPIPAPVAPGLRRHAPRASTGSTSSLASSVLPIYSNPPPAYSTPSTGSGSKLGRRSFGRTDDSDDEFDPELELVMSPAPPSEDLEDDSSHFALEATLDNLASHSRSRTESANADPLDALLVRTSQILRTSEQILASCIDSRRQLDRYFSLESSLSSSLFEGERQLRRSLGRSDECEEQLEQLGREVDAFADRSATGTGRAFGTSQAVDPRSFMIRNRSNGHRSQSSVSFSTGADDLPTTSHSAAASLATALAPSALPFARSESSSTLSASDALAGALGSQPPSPSSRQSHRRAHTLASTPSAVNLLAKIASSSGSASLPTPNTTPSNSPSPAVAALMRRTSSSLSLSGASSPLGRSSPTTASSRSTFSLLSVAEDELDDPPVVDRVELTVEAGDVTPKRRVEKERLQSASPITPRSLPRRPCKHTPGSPSISLSHGQSPLSSLPSTPSAAKSFGGVGHGLPNVHNTPVARPAFTFPPSPEQASPLPIAIESGHVSRSDSISSLASVSVSASHQRPSSLQQRHSSAGEDLMRIHAAGSSAHNRKESQLKETLEGLRERKEEGGGWWAWGR